MFEQEFTALETFGKIFLNRFFDNPGARKPNQGIGFTADDIAQHGKRSRGATECWISTQRDIRYLGIA